MAFVIAKFSDQPKMLKRPVGGWQGTASTTASSLGGCVAPSLVGWQQYHAGEYGSTSAVPQRRSRPAAAAFGGPRRCVRRLAVGRSMARTPSPERRWVSWICPLLPS